MWAYWGSKIDKKSDTMDAYWGSFLSVWKVSSPVFFALIQIFFLQSSNPFTFISIDNLPYHKFTNISTDKQKYKSAMISLLFL